MAIGINYRNAKLYGGAALAYLSRSGQNQNQGFRYRNPGSNTQTITKKRKPKQVIKSFKRMVYDTEQAKHYTFDVSTVMTHNTIYTCMPTQGITQGTGISSRQGDEVYLCAIRLSGVCVTSVDENAYKYRIMVGYTGEEYTTGGIANTFPVALTSAELFLPSTGTLLPVNGLVNAKAFTCLYDEVVDINSNLADVADWTSFRTTVQLNTVFPYQAGGSVFGKTKNLVVVLTSAVAAGSAGVTSTGSIVLSADLIFKSG